MKKVLLITPVLFSINGFSQNTVFVSDLGNLGNQAVQLQNVQVFASNIFANDNNTNKSARANANPQAYVQRASSPSGNQRRQVRRRVTNVANTNISNPVQTNIINLSNNINDDIQLQGNFSQQVNDNLGNAFGNENMIEQIASANIPAIQIGTGALNLDLDINMPKIKLPSMKFSSRKTVSSSRHKTFHVRSKLAKLNRKMSGKLSFGKKLKIKVDNCFKW
jgi:hypothetical protein